MRDLERDNSKHLGESQSLFEEDDDQSNIFDETLQSHRINIMDPEPGLRRATEAYLKKPEKYNEKVQAKKQV